MNKNLLIFIFITNTIFSQTFRNGFDNYESGAGGGFGQGVSFHSNVRGELNSGEAIYLQSYLNMFKATKDKKYLDKFIVHAKRVQERRDDNILNIYSQLADNFPINFGSTTCGHDIFGNPITQSCQINGLSQIDQNSKAWSTLEDICNCTYNVKRVLHSAALTFPMAEFVCFMKTDPDFYGCG